MVNHYVSIHYPVKLVTQRKQKFGKENRASIHEEVGKLSDVSFIREMKYPTWITIMVLVWKYNNKWHMCVDFTNMNVACPKDLYLLPGTDRLIDRSSRYCTLRFMDAYSGYHQIHMDPLDASKTSFMSNHGNYYYYYYYNAKPFGLKNFVATY